MTTDDIRSRLFALQDVPYRDFQAKLIPTVDPGTMIGVRTPALRKLAKELAKTDAASAFLAELPHRYFDENQLHAFLISEIKDFDVCIAETERFLRALSSLRRQLGHLRPDVPEDLPETPPGTSSVHPEVDRSGRGRCRAF